MDRRCPCVLGSVVCRRGVFARGHLPLRRCSPFGAAGRPYGRLISTGPASDRSRRAGRRGGARLLPPGRGSPGSANGVGCRRLVLGLRVRLLLVLRCRDELSPPSWAAATLLWSARPAAGLLAVPLAAAALARLWIGSAVARLVRFITQTRTVPRSLTTPLGVPAGRRLMRVPLAPLTLHRRCAPRPAHNRRDAQGRGDSR